MNDIATPFREMRRVSENLYLSNTAGSSGPHVRMLRAGVCGTDIQILTGSRPDTAQILGHEGSGVSMGGPLSGQFVVFNPVSSVDQDSVLGHSFDGLFRDIVAAPGLETMRLPGEYLADLSALIEPTATACYALEIIRPFAHASELCVWGDGAQAALIALVARFEKLAPTIVASSAERAQYLRQRLSSADIKVTTESNLKNIASNVGACIIATSRRSTAASMSVAAALVREGGAIHFMSGVAPSAGVSEPASVQVNSLRRLNVKGLPAAHHRQEWTTGRGKAVKLSGQRGTALHHLQQAAKLLREHCQLGLVVDRVVSLESATDLLRLSLQRPSKSSTYDRPMKVLIDFTLKGNHSRALTSATLFEAAEDIL